MFAENRITQDPEIETRLRDRYGDSISKLESSGCTYAGALETEHHLPLLPIALCFGIIGREKLQWKSPFRISWYHPIMHSEDGTTLVYMFGIGTRLYTFFEDGSAHRTTASIGKESTQYMKRCDLFVADVNTHRKNVCEILDRHLGFVDQYRNSGKSPLVSADDKLVSMQNAEDSFLTLAWASCMGWGIPITIYSLFLTDIVAA